jgi:hypothetical protein
MDAASCTSEHQNKGFSRSQIALGNAIMAQSLSRSQALLGNALLAKLSLATIFVPKYNLGTSG